MKYKVEDFKFNEEGQMIPKYDEETGDFILPEEALNYMPKSMRDLILEDCEDEQINNPMFNMRNDLIEDVFREDLIQDNESGEPITEEMIEQGKEMLNKKNDECHVNEERDYDKRGNYIRDYEDMEVPFEELALPRDDYELKRYQNRLTKEIAPAITLIAESKSPIIEEAILEDLNDPDDYYNSEEYQQMAKKELLENEIQSRRFQV